MITEQIILNSQKPGDIFTNDAKNEYRKLVKIWHPDINKSTNANEVFKKLSQLYRDAINIIRKGENLEKSNEIILDNKYRIKSYKEHDIKIGKMYISHNIITFKINKEYEDLYYNYINIIKELKFASPEMEKEVRKYLPKIIKIFKEELILIVEKDRELVLLEDVLQHFKTIDPRNSAWILSTLHNLLCYLNFTNISHNNISTNTYFIHPKMHYGALLGGWWYSNKINEPLKTLPKETYNIIPKGIKTSSKIIDGESIKYIGRKLINNTNPPEPMKRWLYLNSFGNPIKEYEIWDEKILKESFGKKKFTELNINFNQLYKGE